MPQSVVAVVVTYNRLATLRKVIDALMGQSFPLREIVVVDNDSTDDTPRYLDMRMRAENRFPMRHVRLPENVGGAGGFARGMEDAYESGADLIWLMDDDCVPVPDALEKLVLGFDDLSAAMSCRSASSGLTVKPGFVCSNVRWTNGEICTMNVPKATWDWNRYYAPGQPYIGVASCSFVSVLINAHIIPFTGYPLREFFIWLDDVEFTARVAKQWPGFAVMDSLVVHETPQNKGVDFRDVTAQNVWKYRYGMRNEAAILAAEPLGTLKVFRRITGQIARMSRNKVPLRLQAQIALSGLSGLRFRYKTKIRYPAPRGG